MEPSVGEVSNSMNCFIFGDGTALPDFDRSLSFGSSFKFNDNSENLSFSDVPFLPLDPDPNLNPKSLAPFLGISSEMDSPDDQDFQETVLKYVDQILMEENLEDKPSMFYDPLALQAAEKSFYEVLGKHYPPSPNQSPLYFDQNVKSPNDSLYGSLSEHSTNSTTTGGNLFDSRLLGDSLECSSRSVESFSKALNGPVNSYDGSHLLSNIFSDSQSILLFKKGVEESRKFLPSPNPLVVDLENTPLLPPEPERVTPAKVVMKEEKDEEGYIHNLPRGRKNHHREDTDLEEERNSKQSAFFVEESELSDVFDRVLLSTEVEGGTPSCSSNNALQNGPIKSLSSGSNGGKGRATKQGNNRKGVMDLSSLLMNCAQSVAADDRRTTNEQLKQIRQNCSPIGDGSQRLAHLFANGLEARLAGTGSQIHMALTSKRPSAAHILKAYQLYMSASPFKKIAIFFANLKIWEMAKKAKKLHIIDFGILYGFQWPILIQHLSKRPGGPPNLRITGIGLPQPGFRPAELVEETGRRLAKYCERFNVLFEYSAIAQKWETIQVEDFKIDSDEVLAVNCLFRFKNLLDETVVFKSPRDAVLKLVRKLNPNVFVHGVLNGSYSAPFFVTRFREALFHYSALFDMFDTNIPCENWDRLMFEREFFGREVMNIIACEGVERVERPETYKQWQVRSMRAGFRPVPLNQEVMKKLRCKVKKGCHRDFLIDEDGPWMLQGWKGRILYASSCWIPA